MERVNTYFHNNNVERIFCQVKKSKIFFSNDTQIAFYLFVTPKRVYEIFFRSFPKWKKVSFRPELSPLWPNKRFRVLVCCFLFNFKVVCRLSPKGRGTFGTWVGFFTFFIDPRFPC